MAKEPVLTAKKLVNLDPSMVDEIKDYRFNQRIDTESEAIRRLLRIGLDLPLLCVNLLDMIDAEGLYHYEDMAEPIAKIEALIGLHQAAEFPQLQKDGDGAEDYWKIREAIRQARFGKEEPKKEARAKRALDLD